MIALSLTIRPIEPLPAQSDLVTILGTWLYSDLLHLAVDGGHIDIATQHCVDDGNLLGAVGVEVDSFYAGVRFDIGADLQIAIEVAFALET